MDWFRWHHGSVTDPKFQLVARKSGASLPDVLAVWAYVLETASQAEERGTFGEIDAEALDCLFNFPGTETRTADILKAMQTRDLIEGGQVVAWTKRQPKREREDNTATERQQRKRDKDGNGGTSAVTPSHATSHQDQPRVEESREEKKKEETPPNPPQAGGDGGGGVASPTKAGTICKAIRAKGIADVNPSNPELLALIAQGVTTETFEAAAETCAKAKPPKGMAYLLGIVKRQLGEAAAIASGPAAVAVTQDPDTQQAVEAEASPRALADGTSLKSTGPPTRPAFAVLPCLPFPSTRSP